MKVDTDLLAAACRALGTDSDEATVTAALTDALRRRQRAAIDALSRLPVDLDPQPAQPPI